jgi:hypothetical protein
MSEFKSWLYENDIACFLLKGAENLPALGRKTGENITLTLVIPPACLEQMVHVPTLCNQLLSHLLPDIVQTPNFAQLLWTH